MRLKDFFRKIIFEGFILKPKVYVGWMVVLTLFLVCLAASSSISEGDKVYAFIWLYCFGFLTFNVSYIFIASVYGTFIKPQILKEKDVQELPKTAIIYTVKNESTGLYERIDCSLANNDIGDNVDLCILSDSDEAGHPFEEEVVRRLREKYGFDKIKYVPRKVPIEKKYGALRQWAFDYMDYKYIYINDADSVMGKGNLMKLIRKAEHPDNQGIANFQSRLNGIHAKTFFAKAMADSAEISQKMYVTTNQAIFGCSMLFGHGCLIRTKCFMQTEVPRGALSHDIWETATLDIKGWRTVFCRDVVAFEEHPSNYLESVKRDRRWLRGHFQSASLIFHPKLSFETRFHIAYGLYVYLAEITFLFWIILNFWKAYTSAYFIPLTYDPVLAFILIFVMGTLWGHKYLFVKNSEDARKITLATLITTLVCLNGVYHKGLAILLLPFTKGGWNPMGKNPYEKISWKELIIAFWPVTILGLSLSYFGIRYAPVWALVSAPFLINFTFSIPLTYLTSLTIE